MKVELLFTDQAGQSYVIGYPEKLSAGGMAAKLHVPVDWQDQWETARPIVASVARLNQNGPYLPAQSVTLRFPSWVVSATFDNLEGAYARMKCEHAQVLRCTVSMSDFADESGQ